MENKALLKKWLIGGLITALIIVLIIWYRNYKKGQEAALAEARLRNTTGNTNNTSVSYPTNDTGKTAIVKIVPASLYTTDGNFTLINSNNSIGTVLGNIIADQTDSGSLAWYKIQNSVGATFYVAKFQVRVQ